MRGEGPAGEDFENMDVEMSREDTTMQEYLAIDEVAGFSESERMKDENVDDLALALEGIEILAGDHRRV